VAGRIDLRKGLGDLAYPYAAEVSATSPQPESSWGAPGGGFPHEQHLRYCRAPPCSWVRRPADHPGGGVTRGAVGPSDVCPAGGPVLPGPGGGSASGALRAAHGEVMMASLVYTLAWATRGAGAVLRDSSSTRTAAAEQFLVDTSPEAIGYQMASRLEGQGQRVAPGPAVPSAGEGSSRAPSAGEPAGSAASYNRGGYPTSAGGYAAAGAAPRRVPRSSWGPVPADRGSAQEYPVDPPGDDHYGGYARDDRPQSPGME